MPRKKQGLRGYHQKSRNGCMKCKSRRVKCDIRTPACTRCIRRNEKCEYPSFIEVCPSRWQIDGTVALSRSMDYATSAYSIHPSVRQLCTNLNSRPSPTDIGSGRDEGVKTHMNILIGSILNRSWFTPAESKLWSNTLIDKAAKCPFLQHCVFSLAYLRRHLQDEMVGTTSVSAYQHQLAASSLFRQGAPEVNSENWIAVMAFNIFTLVFQFVTQSKCSTAEFDLVNTMRVLRSSMGLGEAAKPFFRESKFWELIVKRSASESFEIDSSLRTNLKSLARAIAESVQSFEYDHDGEQRAKINLEAFAELCTWVVTCDAHPRRWDHYCLWPGSMKPEFLDLLTNKNDIALLLVVYWCAILYRSPKPSVYNWAFRAAQYAIQNLSDRAKWEDQLTWPLQSFCESRNGRESIMRMAKDLQCTVPIPEQDTTVFNLPHYIEGSSVSTTGIGFVFTSTTLNSFAVLNMDPSMVNDSLVQAGTARSLVTPSCDPLIFEGNIGLFDDPLVMRTATTLRHSYLLSHPVLDLEVIEDKT